MKATPTRHVEREHTSPTWAEDSKVLWALDDGTHVVSSSVRKTVGTFPVDEVMVFPADESIWITDWGELGSQYPAGDHAAAIRNAGYEPTGEIPAPETQRIEDEP
ncbi:hypothetical protein [Corynebacterium pygosceleis]|uniref:hypothetical protein n=1 Tax=Corynebacterium pygosceleis TaxID=2800406 RepID=UPI002006B28D|nr:hypothetical protein [Corynebacterium pygosceleis]MCK7676408.1 hypothetical protein [Corynebacterium pygosceleis]